MFLQKAMGGKKQCNMKNVYLEKGPGESNFEIYISQGIAMGTCRMIKLKILKWQQLSFSLTQSPLEYFHFASLLSDVGDLSTSLFLSN